MVPFVLVYFYKAVVAVTNST